MLISGIKFRKYKNIVIISFLKLISKINLSQTSFPTCGAASFRSCNARILLDARMLYVREARGEFDWLAAQDWRLCALRKQTRFLLDRLLHQSSGSKGLRARRVQRSAGPGTTVLCTV